MIELSWTFSPVLPCREARAWERDMLVVETTTVTTIGKAAA